MKCNFQ